jgi:hypothetical protein
MSILDIFCDVDDFMFVELIPGTLLPMCIYLYSRRGHQTGLSFVDSTSIAVCHRPRRAPSFRVAGLYEV